MNRQDARDAKRAKMPKHTTKDAKDTKKEEGGVRIPCLVLSPFVLFVAFVVRNAGCNLEQI